MDYVEVHGRNSSCNARRIYRAGQGRLRGLGEHHLKRTIMEVGNGSARAGLWAVTGASVHISLYEDLMLFTDFLKQTTIISVLSAKSVRRRGMVRAHPDWKNISRVREERYVGHTCVVLTSCAYTQC